MGLRIGAAGMLLALVVLVGGAYAAEPPVPKELIAAALKSADCGLELDEALESVDEP